MNLQQDRVMKFIDACYECGIRNPESFLISKMPMVYNWLKGAFINPKILPTDIDGEVEVNGHFLRMEFKHDTAIKNGRIPEGQHRCFKALIKTGRFTIFLIGTDDQGEPSCLIIYYHTGKIKDLSVSSKSDIYEQCLGWTKYALSNGDCNAK